jgi:hypothetical protein
VKFDPDCWFLGFVLNRAGKLLIFLCSRFRGFEEKFGILGWCWGCGSATLLLVA